MDEPLNLVLFSGTDDKLQAAAVLTAGAAALGKPVNVFLQYWALDAFRADRIAADHGLAPEAGARRSRGRRSPACGGPGRAGPDTLRQAKELGGVDIQACSLSMDLLHLAANRSRPARRRRGGRHGLLPERRRRPGRLHLSRWEARHDHADHADGRRTRAVLPDADREDRAGHQDGPAPAGSSRSWRPIRDRSRTSPPGRGRPGTRSSSNPRTAASTASSCDGSEAR